MKDALGLAVFVSWLAFLGWLTGDTDWGGWPWGLILLVLIGAGWGAADLIRHPVDTVIEEDDPADAVPDEHSRDLRYL